MFKKFFIKTTKTPILFFIFLGLVASLKFFSNLGNTVYQCDEYSYLRKSYFTDHLFSGDFSNPDWQNGDAYDQTKFMEYFYALPSYALYGKSFLDLAGKEGAIDGQSYINYSDWAVTYGQPAKNLQVSPRLYNVLILGRAISAAFTVGYLVLASIAIYFITRSYLFATITFTFLLFHPIVSIHGQQILADSALNFFLTAGFLILLKLVNLFASKKINFKKLKKISLASSLVAFLAASTKLNGFSYLLTFQAIFFFLTISKYFKFKLKLKELLKLLIIFTSHAFLSLSLFILIHPSAWPNPLNSFKRFFSWRWDITAYYQGYFPNDSINSIAEAIKLVFLRTAGYMNGVGSIGFNYEQVYTQPPSGLFLVPIITFFCLGLFWLFKNLFSKPTSQSSKTFLITLYTAINLIIPLSYIKLDWTRYYWPLFLPILIVINYGLSQTLQYVKKA